MDLENVFFIQHVPFETPGFLIELVSEIGQKYSIIKPFEVENSIDIEFFPKLTKKDLLIVLGGPMGIYDEDKFPWLKIEKIFIKKAIEKGVKILGICLGAQLLAVVLGAKVIRNKEKEIGKFPIKLTKNGKENRLFDGFPSEFDVIHWHGDTFMIPEKAEHLAFSTGCENQAFIYNNQVLALQFHLEPTKESLKLLIENGEDDLNSVGRFVQRNPLEHISDSDFNKMHQYLKKLISNFLSL